MLLGNAAACGSGIAALATAGTVQITQTDNLVSNTLGDLSDRDLTMDGNPNLPELFNVARTYSAIFGILNTMRTTTPSIGTRIGWAGYSTSVGFYEARAGSNPRVDATTSTLQGPLEALGFFPFSFTDERINNGLQTDGFIEVSAKVTSKVEHSVELLRLIFDDESTLEPQGISPGDPAFPEWAEATNPPLAENPDAQRILAIQKTLSDIKKLKKKLKKIARSGNRSKAAKLTKKLRQLKKKLKKLKRA